MKRLITLIFIFASITAFGQSVTRQLTFNSKISEGNNPDSLGFTGPGLQPGYFYKAAYIRTHFGGTDSLYFNTTMIGAATFLSPLGVNMDTIGYLKANWYVKNNGFTFKTDSINSLLFRAKTAAGTYYSDFYSRESADNAGGIKNNGIGIMNWTSQGVHKIGIGNGSTDSIQLTSAIVYTKNKLRVPFRASDQYDAVNKRLLDSAITTIPNYIVGDGLTLRNDSIIFGGSLQHGGSLTLGDGSPFTITGNIGTISLIEHGSFLTFNAYLHINSGATMIGISDYSETYRDGFYWSEDLGGAYESDISGKGLHYKTDNGDLTYSTFGARAITDVGFNDARYLGATSILNADSLNHQLGSYYLDRANHTGTQAQSTVTNLVSDLAGKQASLGFTPENVANKATGFGTLNNTLYPTTQAVATYVAAQIPTTPSLQSVATVGNSYTEQIQAQNFAATGTGSNGYMDLISQSTSPTSTTSHIKIYSDSVNRLSWKNSTYRRTIQVPYPSDYTIRMPYLVTGTTLEDSTHASATYAPKFVGTGYSKFASGILSYVTAIPNADLANSAITLNGTSTSLGGTFTVTKSNTDTTSTGFATHSLLNTYLTQASGASTYVPQTRTVAGFALSGNVTLASLTATNGTLTLTGTPYNGSSSASFGVNMANANTWTAAQTVNRANIVTTPTNSFIASNTTSATSPVPVQISGAYGYTAQVWNTSGTPATNSMNALTDLEPISSAAPVSNLSTYFQLNGGGYTLAQSLKSDGSILHTGTLVATANSQIVKGIQGTYTFTDGAFTGVIHDAMQLNFGASLTSYFHITDATGAGEVDLHFGGSTPTSSNWAFRGNSASTYLNAPTTSLFMRVANTTIGTWGGTGLTMALATRFFVTEGTNGSVGQTALVAGTKAITITGITTSSRAFVQMVTPGSTTLTTTYQAVCTANTLTLQANVAAGTINTADTSTLNYWIIN